MAKVHSIIKFSGTISDITLVNSKAYGAHARAKRGTYKSVTLPDGMKASAIAQTLANQMAKIIFDAVNVFAPGFKNGIFWSRLIKEFRRQKKANLPYSYLGFHQMEMRPDYPISKHGDFIIRKSERNENISLSYTLYRQSDYRLSILRIATDESLLNTYATEMQIAEVAATANNGRLNFEFTELPENAQVLYCLKCEQLENGQSKMLLRGKGVSFFSNY